MHGGITWNFLKIIGLCCVDIITVHGNGINIIGAISKMPLENLQGPSLSPFFHLSFGLEVIN